MRFAVFPSITSQLPILFFAELDLRFPRSKGESAETTCLRWNMSKVRRTKTSWYRSGGYAPSFMAAYSAHFAKPTKGDFNAYRVVRDDENLDETLTWREARRVNRSLTVRYDRPVCSLEDTPTNRRLLHKYGILD